MSEIKVWAVGDNSEALCPECKGWRKTTFQRRPFRLDSGIVVPDTLVGVCDACGTIADIPHQSAPDILAARARGA